MDIEKALLEKFSSSELDKRLQQKIDEFQGLLTREVALKLIATEEGLLKQEERAYYIRDIPAGARNFSVTATIQMIYPEKRYSSGKRSRTILITDTTDKTPFTVWNNDVDIIARLKAGDRIEIKNAYEKRGEILLSYKGQVQLVKAAAFPSLAALPHLRGPVTIYGKITKIGGKKTSKVRAHPYFSFQLSDDKATVQCILWEGLDRANHFTVGDELVVENTLVKNNELHLYKTTRILVKKLKNTLSGIIQNITCEGDKLKLLLNDKQLTLNRKQGLRLLRVEASPDIALATIVTLKKHSLLNKFINLDNI